MKRFLAPILLVTILFPSLALGLGLGDLVLREGLYYEKFSNVPFTGKVTDDTRQVSVMALRFLGEIKDGKREGLWTSFYENGQLWWKGPYKDGKLNGPYVWYYDNGQLSSEGTYKDGKREGPWVTYWGNGTVIEEYTGTFKDGVKVE